MIFLPVNLSNVTFYTQTNHPIR